MNNNMIEIEEEIKCIIKKELPLVNTDSVFLFSELDSLGITMIMMILSDKYNIQIDAEDATPRNFKDIHSLASMVINKMEIK